MLSGEEVKQREGMPSLLPGKGPPGDPYSIVKPNSKALFHRVRIGVWSRPTLFPIGNSGLVSSLAQYMVESLFYSLSGIADSLAPLW